MTDRTPVIVDALETPIGRLKGGLAKAGPDDLAGVVRAIAERHPAMEQPRTCTSGRPINPAKTTERRQDGAYWRGSCRGSGVTVSRLCGSGMEAILQAAKSIISGESQVYIAGGVESMTRAPFVMPKSEDAFPRAAEIFDTSLGWRMNNPRMNELYPIESLGQTAENVADRYGLTEKIRTSGPCAPPTGCPCPGRGMV